MCKSCVFLCIIWAEFCVLFWYNCISTQWDRHTYSSMIILYMSCWAMPCVCLYIPYFCISFLCAIGNHSWKFSSYSLLCLINWINTSRRQQIDIILDVCYNIPERYIDKFVESFLVPRYWERLETEDFFLFVM